MKKPFRFGLSPIALCLALALGAGAAHAQNTTAAVGGRVTSADGRPVAGASVNVLHVESGTVSRLTTDAEGHYLARGLRAGGPYTVTIVKDGRTERREDVYLLLAETLPLDVRVGAGAPRETIVVSAEAVDDKFASTSMGAETHVGKAQLDAFPSVQRNLQDYARLDPRVAQTDKERGELSVAGQNSRYNKVSVDGMNISDTFGLEANTLPTLKQPVSIDAIQSVQVNVANYDVSQTAYVGGNINAVTKSGTNDLRGTVSYVLRNESLAGDRYNRTTGAYTPPPDFKEDLRGFTLGGPILKDRLFFFLGYEELESTRNAPNFGPVGSASGGIVGITQSAIEAIRNLASSRYQADLGTVGSSGSELVVKDYLAKLDWNISARHRANVRFTRTEQTEPIFQNFSATQLATTTNLYNQEKKLDTLVAQWFADWSSSFSTELKVSRREYHSEPVSPTTLPQMVFSFAGALPATAPAGVNSGTRSLVTGTERSRHFNILDTGTDDIYFGGTYLLGGHEIKALVDYTDNKIYNAFLQDTKGNYTFSCVNSSATYTYSFGSINCGSATAAQVEVAILENFQRGRPSSYLVQVPRNQGGSLFDGVAQFHIENTGFGLQDTWSVNDRLTLQYGVRVDRTGMPQRPLANTAAAAPVVAGAVSAGTVTRSSGGFGLDNTHTLDGETLVQPRVSFNYLADLDLLGVPQSTQVRGGAGLFQGAAATVWISNIYSNTGVATRVVGCGTAGFAACPPSGGIFSPDSSNQPTSFPGAAPAANVDFLQNGLQQPSVWKLNLAVDQRLPWLDMVASLEYIATRTNVGIYYQHLNLGGPTRTGPDGRPLFYTPTAYLPGCWNATGGRITTGATCGVDNRARALSNPAYNNVLLAAKTERGEGQLATASLAGRAFSDLRWQLSYTYTKQTEVSPLTSSVANSNWNARSSFDPNAEEEANSAYLVKDRVNLALTWEKALFRGLKTRVGLFYEGRTGKPYSWTFANDMNGDAISGNDLLYVPRAFGSNDVIFLGDTATSRANERRFWDVVEENRDLARYAGRVVERNSSFSPWTNSVDLRISQDLPGLHRGHKAVVALDILNFGNLLNKRWGHINEMSFQGGGAQIRRFVNFVGIDPASGKYIYAVRNTDDFTVRQARGESQWAAQVTLRYEF